jgi:hypothetical protein
VVDAVAAKDNDVVNAVLFTVFVKSRETALNVDGTLSISQIMYAVDSPHPVKATDTHEVCLGLSATHKAPLDAVAAVEIPICRHKFPAESVTLTAGTAWKPPLAGPEAGDW